MNNFVNTFNLFKFFLKKDRIYLLIWSLFIIFFTLIILYFPNLYPTQADRDAIVQTMNSPSMVAMCGKQYGNAPYNIGEVAGQQMFIFTILITAAMNIFVALRNSRSEEESGLLEMINSLPVGRFANIGAIGLELIIVNVINATVITFGLNLAGIDGIDLHGSFVYCFTQSSVGLVFGCVALICAQLVTSNRSATFLAFVIYLCSYLFRAIADISMPFLSWLSPFGYALKAEVFVNNYSGPIIISLILSIIGFGLSMYLTSIRDINSGLIPIKQGKARAGLLLRSSFGFIFRLERFLIIAWLVILAILGMSYGSIFNQINSFASNAVIAQVLNENSADLMIKSFIVILGLIVGVCALVPSLFILLRIVKDERNEIIEQLYALPLSRTKLLAHYLILAVLICILGTIVGLVGVYFASSIVMADPVPLYNYLQAAVNVIPALLVIIGLTVFLIGNLPRLVKIVWFYVIYSFFIVYFGSLLKLPEWVNNTSVLSVLPRVPIDSFDYYKMGILVIIFIILTVLGFVGYNKRDIKN